MDNLRPVDVLAKGGHCETTCADSKGKLEPQVRIAADLCGAAWDMSTKNCISLEQKLLWRGIFDLSRPT